ncbi:MAG: cadmium-translocating P-type ATPase [Acidimicrobiia bacterium]|nr:cadmium-translocating P-type ATPase [Acidimicrobiia bacterium]
MSDPDRAVSFHIDGMDCAEEVAVLKRAVGPLVGGEENLSFEVLNGKMTIQVSTGSVSPGEVAEAISRTGMSAQPWREAQGEESPADATFWQRRGRSLLCWASGALLSVAFGLHAVAARSPLAALEAEKVPAPAIVLYLLATVAGAWFIAPKALYAARTLRPDMNFLMLVAVIGAIGIGEWFEAATVSFLFALALLLEKWSVGRARRAIGALMELSPDLARVVDPETNRTRELPVGDVHAGALVRIRPGDKVPLDGEILEGSTSIDQSAITGESMPVAKNQGDAVFAGTVNGTGTIEVRVTKAAGDTALAAIIRLVAEAQARRSPSEQWVDRFARYYTPIMMALAIGVAALPPLLAGGSWAIWFYRALVLLVIACPCALVISTPVSVVAGLASAARAGVLIKGGNHLEAPAGFQAIAFDKTGTLTHGRPQVQRIVGLNGHTEEEVLARAAALEVDSSHPLALAVLDEAQRQAVPYGRAESVTILPGKGAEGDIDGRRFWIGSHRLMEEKGAETPEFHQLALEMEDAGHSLVAVGNDDHICGLLGVADGIRDGTAAVLDELRELGVRELVMLTGDNEGTARAVAEATRLQEYRAELLPPEKVAAVAGLRERFASVAMVGDGVNDAPALATATAGIAMGAAGTDAAIETADIALMSDDLSRLPWLIRHSRRVLRVIRQNIFFSLAVKAAFIALAALGMATLWMAIAADMGASLLVVANGLRLLR